MSESTRLRKAVDALRSKRDELILKHTRLDAEVEECQLQISRIREERTVRESESATLKSQQQKLLEEVQKLRDKVEAQKEANYGLREKIDGVLAAQACTIENLSPAMEVKTDESA